MQQTDSGPHRTVAEISASSTAGRTHAMSAAAAPFIAWLTGTGVTTADAQFARISEGMAKSIRIPTRVRAVKTSGATSTAARGDRTGRILHAGQRQDGRESSAHARPSQPAIIIRCCRLRTTVPQRERTHAPRGRREWHDTSVAGVIAAADAAGAGCSTGIPSSASRVMRR